MNKPVYLTPRVLKSKSKMSMIGRLYWNVIKEKPLRALAIFTVPVLYVFVSNNVIFNIRDNILIPSTKIEEDKDNKHLQSLRSMAIEEDGSKMVPLESAEDVVRGVTKSDRFLSNVFTSNSFKFHLSFFGLTIIKKESISITHFLTIMFFFYLMARSTFAITNYLLTHIFADDLEKDLKKDLMYIFLSSRFTDSAKIAKKVSSYVISDLKEISLPLFKLPNRMLLSLLSLVYIFSSGGIFGQDTKGLSTLLILSVIFTILGIIYVTFLRMSSRYALKIKKTELRDNDKIFESVQNLEYIKTVSSEKEEIEKINAMLEKTHRTNQPSLIKGGLFEAFPNWFFMQPIPLYSTVIFVFLGWAGVLDPASSAFMLVSVCLFYDNAFRINLEVSKILDGLLEIDDFTSSLSVVGEGLASLYRGKRISGTLPFQNGDIEFRNVTFAYPDREDRKILNDFSFTFKKGLKYGIIGPNGIGKSTLSKIFLKLYNFSSGEVLVNGVSIRKIRTEDLHKKTCYQTNHPALFSISIAENAYYPLKKPQFPKDYQKKLLHISDKIELTKFISKLKEGFDEKIRINIPGSAALSEGEKQKIGSTRLFVNEEADIFILDELMSNVSPRERKKSLKHIFEFLKDKTVIVIDHRPEIFVHVDELYEFTPTALKKRNKETVMQQKTAHL